MGRLQGFVGVGCYASALAPIQIASVTSSLGFA
jgi:hypothetical protein